MGGHPYYYFVPYEPDISKALEALRKREFEAGRYNPVLMFPEFPIGPDSPRPGPAHRSIAEALEASDADGTRSILDMERVGPKPDFGVAVALTNEKITELFNTGQPTREMVEQNMDFFAEIERGNGVCFVVFAGGKPAEIFFAGYSYD